MMLALPYSICALHALNALGASKAYNALPHKMHACLKHPPSVLGMHHADTFLNPHPLLNDWDLNVEDLNVGDLNVVAPKRFVCRIFNL